MKSADLLIITDYLNWPHGTERHAVELALAARRHGMTVRIQTCYYQNELSAWHGKLSDAGIFVDSPLGPRLKRFKGSSLLNQYAVNRTIRAINQSGASIVWSPDGSRLLCQVMREKQKNWPPLFAHEANAWFPGTPYYPAEWPKTILGLTGLSTHGINQTKRALQSFPEMEGRIASVWPSSEMPEDLNSGGSELGRPIRFGQFGRLVTQKGHFLSIAALKRTIVLGGDAELHIFGDGIDRNHLLEIVRALDVEDRVFFHGQYLPDDVGRLVHGIDVGLVSSIHEGFGLVMLEMMSRSKPVISSDVGSAREVLEGLGGGWVVPVADTEAMAQAMLSCCRNRASTLQKGQEAREVWKKHFTPEGMFSRYLDFWKKCRARL